MLILGTIYSAVGFHYLMQARNVGLSTVFYLLLIVWSTDSGAYIVGRKIGKINLHHTLVQIKHGKVLLAV